MLIDNRNSFIEILCPAKVNLFLEIKGKRDDGYHEIETLMQTVSIYDRLVIEPAASGTELTCSDASIPCGKENTVRRAVDELRKLTGISSGVRIHLEKKIPAGAGLAGGSSDAAGALAGLNLLWKTDLDREALSKAAANVGSDVPFFLWGGAAICRGRGEIIEPVPTGDPLNLVVVWPGFEISTKTIYGNLKLGLTEHNHNDSILSLQQILNSTESERAENDNWFGGIDDQFFNRLQATAFGLNAELYNVKKAMLAEGLSGVTMTGSGSAFFGLANRKEVAQKTTDRLMAAGIGTAFACESTKA